MNNIWKYSLVLAFSIILDQLLKGTAQSLIPMPGEVYEVYSSFFFVREVNPYFPFGIKIISQYANTICWITHVGLIFYSLKKIIYFRNRNPIKGWGVTFLLMSFFTSWLDRYSQGSTLDYLAIGSRNTHFSFSYGDISFFIGLVILFYSFLKRGKC